MNGALLILLVFLAAVIWMLLDPRDDKRARVLYLALGVAVYSPICGLILHSWDRFFPLKFDASLYQIDSAIGLTSFAVARALRTGWTGMLLGTTYTLMLPMMALWCAVEAHKNWRGPSILLAFAIEMFSGLALYALLPACGPIYASPGFPFKDPSFGSMHLSGYPNAIPSLHVSTALLLVLFARGRGWKLVSIAFLAATALATLTTGEHYLVDLIAAVPFSCFVVSALRRRFVFSAACLCSVLAWMLLIRLRTPWLGAHPEALRIGGCAMGMLAAGKLMPIIQRRTRKSHLRQDPSALLGIAN